jgi:hypothetical protein
METSATFPPYPISAIRLVTHEFTVPLASAMTGALAVGTAVASTPPTRRLTVWTLFMGFADDPKSYTLEVLGTRLVLNATLDRLLNC